LPFLASKTPGKIITTNIFYFNTSKLRLRAKKLRNWEISLHFFGALPGDDRPAYLKFSKFMVHPTKAYFVSWMA
jgi:hypothetical protein